MKTCQEKTLYFGTFFHPPARHFAQSFPISADLSGQLLFQITSPASRHDLVIIGKPACRKSAGILEKRWRFDTIGTNFTA
jgi:hypothetical protein